MKNESDINNEIINNYEDKIKDYIMNKIYEKIYPLEPDDKDTEIYKKILCLSKVYQNSFVKKDYIYDTLIPIILDEFKQINIVKNPDGKYNCMSKIMGYIYKLIIFNEGDESFGTDNMIPSLVYIFIKAHPFMFFTDIEFVKLFLNKEEIINVGFMEMVYNLILNRNNQNFNANE